MPRIEYAQEGQEAAGATETYSQLKEGFGMVPNLVKLVGHSGPVTELMGNLITTYFNKLAIDPQIREIAYLTATNYNGCPYCLGHHTMAGKKAGLTDAQIPLLSEEGLTSDLFSDKEKSVIRFSYETTKDVVASDEALEELKKHFTTEEIIEITFAVATPNFIQRIGKNFGAELEM